MEMRTSNKETSNVAHDVCRKARMAMDWYGSKYTAVNSLGISWNTFDSWVNGRINRINKVNLERLNTLCQSIDAKQKKVAGLAAYYGGVFAKAMTLDPMETQRAIRAIPVQLREPKTDQLALSFSDFNHNRKRFACIIMATIMPHLSKRDVWELVKRTVPNIEN